MHFNINNINKLLTT